MMALNKSKGNMYPWVTHTWNPIRGCRHDCIYCYVKAIKNYDMEPRLIAKELKTDLGSGRTIFVCSTADMFGAWIPEGWIEDVLKHCNKHDNTYLFQTKNPARYARLLDEFPTNIILGTTIETNRHSSFVSEASYPIYRVDAMRMLDKKYTTMISIEPIMDFDFWNMRDMISMIQPAFVSIGADSKGHNLSEPPAKKIQRLIDQLRTFTRVILKSNLSRLGRFK